MKVYLQRISDEYYYCAENKWCKERASAFSYPNMFAATTDILTIGKQTAIDLIIAFDGCSSIYDIRLTGSRPAENANVPAQAISGNRTPLTRRAA